MYQHHKCSLHLRNFKTSFSLNITNKAYTTNFFSTLSSSKSSDISSAPSIYDNMLLAKKRIHQIRKDSEKNFIPKSKYDDVFKLLNTIPKAIPMDVSKNNSSDINWSNILYNVYNKKPELQLTIDILKRLHVKILNCKNREDLLNIFHIPKELDTNSLQQYNTLIPTLICYNIIFLKNKDYFKSLKMSKANDILGIYPSIDATKRLVDIIFENYLNISLPVYLMALDIASVVGLSRHDLSESLKTLEYFIINSETGVHIDIVRSVVRHYNNDKELLNNFIKIVLTYYSDKIRKGSGLDSPSSIITVLDLIRETEFNKTIYLSILTSSVIQLQIPKICDHSDHSLDKFELERTQNGSLRISDQRENISRSNAVMEVFSRHLYLNSNTSIIKSNQKTRDNEKIQGKVKKLHFEEKNSEIVTNTALALCKSLSLSVETNSITEVLVQNILDKLEDLTLPSINSKESYRVSRAAYILQTNYSNIVKTLSLKQQNLLKFITNRTSEKICNQEVCKDIRDLLRRYILGPKIMNQTCELQNISYPQESINLVNQYKYQDSKNISTGPIEVISHDILSRISFLLINITSNSIPFDYRLSSISSSKSKTDIDINNFITYFTNNQDFLEDLLFTSNSTIYDTKIKSNNLIYKESQNEKQINMFDQNMGEKNFRKKNEILNSCQVTVGKEKSNEINHILKDKYKKPVITNSLLNKFSTLQLLDILSILSKSILDQRYNSVKFRKYAKNFNDTQKASLDKVFSSSELEEVIICLVTLAYKKFTKETMLKKLKELDLKTTNNDISLNDKKKNLLTSIENYLNLYNSQLTSVQNDEIININQISDSFSTSLKDIFLEESELDDIFKSLNLYESVSHQYLYKNNKNLLSADYQRIGETKPYRLRSTDIADYKVLKLNGWSVIPILYEDYISLNNEDSRLNYINDRLREFLQK